MHIRNSNIHVFNRLTSESQQHILSARRPATLLLYPYHNTKTFVNLTNSLSIPKDKLLVLDNYAFDVDELKLYAKNNLKKFFCNPHITSKHENNAFSEAALAKIRAHRSLAKYAKVLDNYLTTQANGISNATIDAVIALLKKLDEHGVEGSTQAYIDFNAYCETLSADNRNKLNNYIINVSVISGGHLTLDFKAALVGGTEAIACIVTAQIYLWQFVVDLRPSALNMIPRVVLELARSESMVIKPKEKYFSRATPVAPSTPFRLEMSAPVPRLNDDVDMLTDVNFQRLSGVSFLNLLRLANVAVAAVDIRNGTQRRDVETVHLMAEVLDHLVNLNTSMPGPRPRR